MDKMKKPSIIVNALTTVGAVFSLLTAMIIIASGKHGTGLAMFQLLTTLLLVIASVLGWHRYSKLYVEYEVEKRLQEESTN
jgi:high-affinity Fe2+/Pb2+ permease